MDDLIQEFLSEKTPDYKPEDAKEDSSDVTVRVSECDSIRNDWDAQEKNNSTLGSLVKEIKKQNKGLKVKNMGRPSLMPTSERP